MTTEEAIKIISQLNIGPDDWERAIIKKICKIFPEVSFEVVSGAFKRCVLFKDANFVVKWDFQNYSLREIEIYEKAKKEGLEMFFPHTSLLFQDNNGVDFIIQDKIDFSAYDLPKFQRNQYFKICRTVSPKIQQKVIDGFIKDQVNYVRQPDNLWVDMAISLYGKKICKKLCAFVRENKINDLHEGNLGYKNNKPIFLDFSGV